MSARGRGTAGAPFEPVVLGLFSGGQPPPPPVPRGRGASCNEAGSAKQRKTRECLSGCLQEQWRTDEATRRFDAVLEVLKRKYPEDRQRWHKKPEWHKAVKKTTNELKKFAKKTQVLYPHDIETRTANYFKRHRLDSDTAVIDLCNDDDKAAGAGEKRKRDNSAGSSAGGDKGKDAVDEATGGSAAKASGGPQDDYGSDGSVIITWPSTIQERYHSLFFKWPYECERFLHKNYPMAKQTIVDGPKPDFEQFKQAVNAITFLVKGWAKHKKESLPESGVGRAVEAFYRDMIVQDMVDAAELAAGLTDSDSVAESDASASDFSVGL